MKVAIDIGPLKSQDKVRGVGFYTKYLLESLEKIAGEFSLDITGLDTQTLIKNAHKFDIIHFPFFKLYESKLPQVDAKIVVTIHDVIPLLHPNQYPSGVRGKVKLQDQKRQLRRVYAVVTDTEASKKDIVRFLGIPSEKIFVTHLAPASHFNQLKNDTWQENIVKKYLLPKRFVLYVGDVNYNKNIGTLIQACNKIKTDLIIVGKQALYIENYTSEISQLHGPRDWARFLFGKPHPEVKHYKQILDLLKDNPRVKRLGFVSDEDLVKIYNLATVYCQPSFSEGFGFPVLEAMACGVPVVASKTQALVEIAEKAAIFVDPDSVDGFAQSFSLLYKNEKKRKTCISKGLLHVKKYNWTITAKETIKAYGIN
ncbi:glycosyltransferase family 4 protein [Candidatus Woesebacteria bacterium]|nr:MAG: glycosyltransferase family 4 protein [Candidatus Woesebacteria bacterium]